MTVCRIIEKTAQPFSRGLAAALLLAPLCVCGDQFLDDDLWYSFEDNSKTRVYVGGLCNLTATHITVPATVVYEYTDYNDYNENTGTYRIKHRTCTVTSIFNSAFYGRTSLMSVTMPNITSIETDTFHGCSSLSSVSMPNVTSIGKSAFYGCSSLASATMPNVTSIGDSAFSYCSSLASVTMPNVTSIGNEAFSCCSSLASASMPSVTSMGYSAFSGCSSLASASMPNVTSIGDSAFYNCSSLANASMPNVTSIGNQAFSHCSSLASVTLPPCLTSMGYSAFSNCSSLENVMIPDSVTSIGSSTFYGCSGLTIAWLGSGVTNIHYSAFNLCENLQRFVVDAENAAYASPDGALCTKDLKTLVVYPRGRVDVRLPDGLTTAMPDAFAGCNKLWMEWCKRINTIPYDLTQSVGDRSIADVTANGDMALDAFVLKEGKVYDSVLYIHNNADHAVRVTLPSMPLTAYKTFKGASPLTLPAYSTSILTITRVAGGNAGGNVFLVTREELETVQ